MSLCIIPTKFNGFEMLRFTHELTDEYDKPKDVIPLL